MAIGGFTGAFLTIANNFTTYLTFMVEEAFMLIQDQKMLGNMPLFV
jgi:hypothetical protein